MTYNGKTVFITGAGSGIGQAAAVAFAKDGATVFATDVDAAGLEATAQLANNNEKLITMSLDVTIESMVQHVIEDATTNTGRLDIALNNAGVFLHEGKPHQVTAEDWQTTMAINVTGVHLCMQHQIRQMLHQESGCIVNMSSVLGLRGAAEAPAYVASKHAVIGLTKSAAIAYATDGIRVNALCPGIIETPMEADLMADDAKYGELLKLYPMRRSGTPDEVITTLLWLCSDAASYITGVALPIDGGHMAY